MYATCLDHDCILVCVFHLIEMDISGILDPHKLQTSKNANDFRIPPQHHLDHRKTLFHRSDAARGVGKKRRRNNVAAEFGGMTL
ncbi:hypothetical protein L596_002105 [Steinernema carpocapsae]|uniref:Uncharacterized protein n=1 Tax=Steinernema carpocapsae TaxID=34508 RepID=A0A4V6I7A9_STECR|nr:hypothetical protein L596_002105 [Steinernema carpocapsae]